MSEMTAATPQLLRRVSAGAVLDFMRASRAVTVTEVIRATGLTRATAISVCEDLMERGWITELENQRAFGGYQKGRPARRFELNERAGYVLGMDVGFSKATVVVSDLRGKALGRASQPFEIEDMSAEERVAVIDRAATMALQSVGAAPNAVLAVCAGIAAPVDRNGNILAAQHFWELFDVGLKSALHKLHGWTVLLENDANLAALGDRWRGAAEGVDDVVVILASERFGSGVIEDGRLLHGSGAGRASSPTWTWWRAWATPTASRRWRGSGLRRRWPATRRHPSGTTRPRGPRRNMYLPLPPRAMRRH